MEPHTPAPAPALPAGPVGRLLSALSLVVLATLLGQLALQPVLATVLAGALLPLALTVVPLAAVAAGRARHGPAPAAPSAPTPRSSPALDACVPADD